MSEHMQVAPGDLVSEVLPRLGGVGAVVDGERFIGTLSDANVRRRLLAEADPGSLTCGDVLDEEPIAVAPGTPDDAVVALLAARNVRVAAIVDGDRFVGPTRVEAPRPTVTAVANAGGRGERLQPITFKVPKPLLQVGRTSVLERTLEDLRDAGVE